MKTNQDARERLDALSPAKRALLQKLMQKPLPKPRPSAAPQDAIGPRPPGEAPPLSASQQRLWFLDQLDGKSATYNMGGAMRLEGPLDAAALERALLEIVRRHEALRTRFVARDGKPVQLISPDARCELERVSLEALPAETQETEVRRLATEHLRSPFDLAGTLSRTTLLRLRADVHVLLLAVHHIVSDGWSIAVFFRELCALYEAYANGRQPELPPLPIQYADYACWQQGSLSRERLAPAIAYWKAQLKDAPATLDLPFDRPRPPVQTFQGRTLRFHLDRALRDRLSALCRETGATLFMTLLSGFAVVLSRYSHQADVVIGSPSANRPRKELEPLIGFFVNTLAMRIDLAGRPTVRELLARVREACVGAYAHQELPFELLVEELKPERNLSHSPVFQVMFVLQNAQADETQLADLKLSIFDPDTGTSMFDMTLFIQEKEDGLAGAVEYNTDLFDEATIARFVVHYRTLLEALGSGPDRRISDLPILDRAERAQCLVAWNETRVEHAGPGTAPALFEAQVERTPDAIAARFEGQSLTYRALDARANQLAAHLAGLGVGQGTLVAVFLDRSLDLLVALLAIQKAGGAYVPMDPSYPHDRLAFMLEDSGAPVVLTEERLASALPPSAATLVVLDRERAAIEAAPAERPRGAQAADRAYVLYTSGSTGKPKGVQVTHRALGNFLLSMAREPGLSPDDRLLAVTTVSFDIAGLELYLPLCVGASVELVSREVASDGVALLATLKRSGATCMQATPATWWSLLEAGLAPGALRKILCGGEALPRELAERLLRTGAEVWNLYGPTETTIWSAASRVRPAPRDGRSADAACPIGRPIANTQIYLLDRDGRPVPIGVPGELYIGGDGLSIGYLNRPALTAERFVPDPFGGVPGARLYRTGDLARFRPDGAVDFLGRADNQIKLRGYRIETGEIEAVLDQHPAVKASAVVCRDAGLAHKELVAYVVEDPAFVAQSEQGSELREQLTGEWQTIWNETYGEDREAAPAALDTVGWKSSYTGDLLPAEEMREWTEATAGRILALGPARVLEVGCGTGMILLRVAPHAQRYVGVDFSAVVLEQLAAKVEERGLAHVRLARGAATELDQLGERGFDAVVLNSVVQYFPSLDYLAHVIEQALALLDDGGAIVLGDVRSLLHLGMQHASVQLHRASPGASRDEIRAAVQRQVAHEQELLIHPGFFASLPERLGGLAGVEIQLRRGARWNEMSKFRYDVVLRKGRPSAERAPSTVDAVDASRWASPRDGLESLLAGTAPDAVIVEGLPNARLADDARIMAWLEGAGAEPTAGALRASLAAQPAPGVDPEDVFRLGESLGYAVEIAWSGSDPKARFDALFRRGGAPSSALSIIDGWPRCAAAGINGWPRCVAAGSEALANDPLAGRRERALVQGLRAHLERHLPAYMVPSRYVRLDAFPLTPNGKVDRKALPAPDQKARAAEQVAPSTEDEARLATIWAEALGVGSVGVTSDFFDLGGHSLLATQVISRIRDAFGIELPLRSLFEARTVQALARELRAREPAAAAPALPVRRTAAPGAAPLSFSQQRLWFLDRLEGPSATYNLFGSLRLRGALDAGALGRAFDEIVRRHDVLRTRIVEVDGQAVQVVSDDARCPLSLEDVAGGEDEARARAVALAHRPFDLAGEPPIRAHLLRLGERDHVLVISAHHIATDEWSIRIFLRELSELYGVFARGEASPLPELTVQYADYARWQRAWLEGEARARQVDYWRSRLAGAPRVLELRADRPRPAVQTFRGRTLKFELDAALTRGLRELSRASGATLFMTLLSGFAAFLSRYSGQRDLVVGTPIANRTRSELEPLIGFFVNTLALRVDLGGDPSTTELLARVRASSLEAHDNQDIPFESLVEELQIERDLRHTPLFQAMFILQNAPLSQLGLAGVEVADFEIDSPIARFDLTLSMEETDRALRAGLEYNTDLFDDATAERMVSHLTALLAAMVARPGVPVSRLPMIADAERGALLGDLSGERRAYDGPETVHALFSRQARRAPDAPAIVATRGALTYAELDRRSDRLAARLQAAGVGPEVLVGLFVEDPTEQVVGLLAILKAGGAYLPIDPRYPAERIAFMLDDSQAPVVLTERHLADGLPSRCDAVLIDADGDSGAGAPRAAALPDNLAYVIYTSGSTGRPKGVGVSHRAICNLARAQLEQYGIDAGSRLLQLVSLSFDVATSDVVMALLCGAALCVSSQEERAPGEGLVERLAAQRITHLQIPASLLVGLPRRELPELRAVVVGGESCPMDVLQRWRSGRRLFNAYGPTETTVSATIGEIGPDDVVAHIGRPVPNARVYILDEHLEPVPTGVAGEIYVGGVQVARGYLGQPGVTAERFLPDPHAKEPGARMYRTGDLARYRERGRIEFLGRTDHQIKLHGNRIELGEVEAALSGHPDVAQAVVVVREDRPGQRRLVAYAALAGGSSVDGEALRRHLQAHLPAHMVPGVCVVLGAMPLTPNGKVDRGALPSPGDAVRAADHVAPRTPNEAILARIWADVLGAPDVGVLDNFFALGGDSIISIQVVSRAKQAGLGLTVKQLFQHQTVAELAAVAVAGRRVSADQGELTGPVALTPIQRWFLEGKPREPHHFNQSVLIEAVGALDPAALADALGHLGLHHDMLRARFRPGRDGSEAWTQEIVAAEEPFPLAVEDLGELASLDAKRTALEASATRAQAALSLAEGSLCRAVLYRLGGGEPDRLLLVVHHLVVDGVSWRILVGDLESAYLQRLRGGRIQLGPKTTSFQEWAARLVEHARSDALLAELPGWLEISAESAALPLDFDVDVAALRTGTTATVTASLDAAATRALLSESAAAYRTQINDVLLTALARTLARHVGRSALRIDLEGHGREDLFDDVDTSRTVGWFTSAFPVVLEADPGAEIATTLRSVKERLRAIPRHGVGYGLLRYLGPDDARARLAQAAPAQITFNYLGRFDGSASGAVLAREAREPSGPGISPREARRYLLEVNAVVTGGRLEVSWVYSPEAHRDSTVKALADGFTAELEALIAHCRAPGAGGYTPSDFPLARLREPVLAQLFSRWGRGIEDAYPLSPVQQGMLFHTLYDRESGAYCQQLVCRLSGGLSPDVLRKAWATVIERHAALRTAFVQLGDDDPVQVVLREVAPPWEILDWRELPAAEQPAALERFLERDRRRGFDPERPPLMRFSLLRLADGWQFVWSHHHLLLDGWSLPIVLGEAIRAYEALVQGLDLDLRRPRPFRDYVAWLAERDPAASERYWRETLAGFRAPTRLGVERTGGAAHAAGRSYGTREIQLSAATTEALRGLSRAARVTMSVVVQAAWAVLLGRYSGESDVVFGATVAGRPAALAGVESMVGLFIATVPVREAPRPALRVVEYLAELQERQVAREPHAHCPLVDIQRWSDVPPGEALFDSLVVFENYPVGQAAADEQRLLRVTDVQALERTNYPLTLFAAPGDALLLRLSYDEARYDGARIAALLGHLERLLEGMARGPDAPLARLPLLSEAERREVLVAPNQTRRDVSGEGLVPALIAAQAGRTPDAVAVSSGGDALTYAELRRRSSALSDRLRGMGVGPEVVVGVFVERSLDLVVGLLGVLEAGGAYLPLDTDYPPERLAFMMRDAGAPLVLTQTHLLERLPETGAQAVCLDAARPAEAEGAPAEADGARPGAPAASAGRAAGPDDTAYVLYTSGSTGRPKGVSVTHANLRNFLLAMRESPGLSARDVLLSVTTISFDIAGLELYLPLVAGARVEILGRDSARDARKLMAALRASGATVMQATPTTWRMLLEETWEPGRLERALCGGEALPGDLAEQLLGRGLEVWNLYGPTETTIWSTVQRIERAAEPGAAPGAVCPIGRPIANTEIYLLDRNLEPVPPGVPGELFIAGDGVARGYLGRAGLTAERFVPDPFGDRPGARMYRTGDLVRYGERGALEFIGRIDNQVKLRGHRIELGEIEAALKQHESVGDAVVVARRDRAGEDQLVAYLVPAPGADVEADALRAWLGERLPAYMAPAAYVSLPSFPLTLNRKVDRAALPAPDFEAGAAASYVAPGTPTEQRLADIWREILGVERPSVTDDFFHLGGHSLRATRAVTKIQDALQVSVPLPYFFGHPTIRELADYIDGIVAAGSPPPEGPGEDEEDFTL
ncbi:amino acid adenylation domain-containing protein [Sorangium sp. So ce1389]|uniref:amino acid adenylation domain-containing protein n=1 Tax=Sorangium sp. So ce1389 TaxID=3133336 RepID=UPI003F6085EC